MSVPTDEALVAACLRQEGPAQQALYMRYGPYTLGICKRMSADEMEAEDMHQIGWIRAFDKLAAWKSQGPLRAWLRKLFLNVCIKAFQKSKKRSTWMSTAPEQDLHGYADPAANLDFAEEALLVTWISALPSEGRLVFNLFAIEGYTHEEIADLLHISVSNSRQQLHRARKQLAILYHHSLKERGLPAID